MPHFEENSAVESGMLEPIAIVGMACRLPGGVDSASSLWDVLENKKSVQTPKVPESRFNIDAYLHEKLDRPGSFNVPGGYFLDGAAEAFDPTFFNITPIEAMWLDPQQRKMLEVTYECLESAGLTLEAVQGSNTAVFVGSFTSDYQQMSTKEGDFRHNYAATGVDTGLISARIGNTFDFNGPSFTINTACSSSVYAIHNACHALRARDANAAVAGGVNLIMTVDQHMNTAKLGILSPTSTCHTFDASADGYGRAEGAGALYLKRLSDAIRDGDPIRGVIRSSAVNTNGKVPGMGITHPSAAGQERVVRQAYARSGLDPLRTAYVECHGTGTPVGDPIEARAVATAMNDTRSTEKPLLIGAIKANIGHSEAASGIFAVMKAAMMTEAGVVPGVCGLKNLNPAIHEKDWNIKVNADTTPWPAGFTERRAGVSSFGYGGTNGHVIVEAIDALYPFYSHGRKRGASEPAKATRPFLLPFSAHDQRTLERNITAHGKVVADYHVADLAYTLSARRSRFSTRAFAVGAEPLDSADYDLSAFTIGRAQSEEPDAAFIFTGQGAQWAAMGAHAMTEFPSFRSTIHALDRVLRRLPSDVRPPWTLEAALSEKSESIHVNDAQIAQPVCTAVQIAIVDLLASWSIVPAVTVGHSSGEIAAAYAAGLISAPEAMVAAYLRGFAVQKHAPVGSMLAVGLGREGIAEYCDRIRLGADVVIACQNSPESLTLSGSREAIEHARQVLSDARVFARELPTGKAYHSPHMARVASEYDTLLAHAIRNLDVASLDWRQERARWFSSVSGSEYLDDVVPPSYWSKNLRQRVLFDEAVVALGTAPGLEQVRLAIEVGPHSALAGPFKQICAAAKLDRFVYVASLVRNKNSAHQLLRTAGSLFVHGYHVDLEAVNSVDLSTESALSLKNKERRPRLLVDLPPYQWNTEKPYWVEPRFSHEQRHLTHGRHDVLGSTIVGLSERSLAWRNEIRHADIPWLRDHKLGKESVFPAAAHLSMAAEALRQVCDRADVEVKSITFRDVELSTALIIPETDNGIEVQLRLTKKHDDDAWFSFAIESFADGQWTLHSVGSLAANHAKGDSTSHPVEASTLTQRVPGKTWYHAFDKVGFEYRDSFQPLDNVRTNKKYQHAAADVEVAADSGRMVGESRYLLHPATIDGCLQLIIVSINAGAYKEMQYGVVPVKFEELTIWPTDATCKTVGKAVAWTDESDGRYFNTHTKLFTEDGDVLLDVKSLRCVSYEVAVPQTEAADRPREPYMQTVWQPDVDTLVSQAALDAFPTPASETDLIANMLELIQHKRPLSQVLLLGQNDSKSLRAVLETASSGVQVTLAAVSEEHIKTLTADCEATDLTTVVINEGLSEWPGRSTDVYDLVVAGPDAFTLASGPRLMKTVFDRLSTKGRALISASAADGPFLTDTVSRSGFLESHFFFDFPGSTVVCANRTDSDLTPRSPTGKKVTVLTSSAAAVPAHAPLVALLQECGCQIQVVDISRVEPFRSDPGATYIVHDTRADLLTELSEKTFDRLKVVLAGNNPIIWLTEGVNEGDSVAGGMSQGLLRVIRSEQASARILLMDLAKDEDVQSVAAAITSVLGKVPTKASGNDTEFWLQHGVLNVPRVLPNARLNAQFSAELAAPQPALLSSGQNLAGKIENGAVVFEAQDDDALADLSESDVEMTIGYASVEAASDSRADVAPSVVTGVIRKVGSKLDAALIGQHAVAYASSPFNTVLRVPFSVAALYSDVGATSLVATLPGLAKAVDSIIDVGKVQGIEHVVLLPAHQNFVAAARELQKALGFKLTTIVVDSERHTSDLASGKHDVLLASDSSGIRSLFANHQPDLVVAQDFSPLSQEIWRSMPVSSRFVLNDSTIDGSLDTVPLSKGVAFLPSGVKSMYKHRPAGLGDLLARTIELIKKHQISWTPSVFATEELSSNHQLFGQASDGLNHNVLKFEPGSSSIMVKPSAQKLKFSPDAAYLLVGCLGGLGRSLTTFMMERGARDFVFLSRSGIDKPEAAALVDSIRRAGAKTQIFRGDASVRNDVEHAIAEVTASRSIKGVVHAAMVLQDGVFDNMSHDQFQATLRPKVDGARVLHDAFQTAALDFFVMTSSISATMGNPGQANYSAANSYLDALAWHRNLKGLPATSLILPMVLGVGVVAESEGLEEALSRKAMYGIDEQELLRAFETAMLQTPAGPTAPRSTPGSSQIILGLEPAYLASAIEASSAGTDEAYWFHDARFSHLRTVIDQVRASGKSASGSRDAGSFAQELKAAQKDGTSAVLHLLCQHIAAKLASMLLIPVEDFAFEGKSIAVYGIDSMIGANLRNWLFNQFALELSFQTLLSPKMSILALAHTVGEHLGVIVTADA